MYTLTIQNNYSQDIGASNGVTVAKGSNRVFNDRGSIIFTIPGMGEMTFIDLGDKKLPGYPELSQTWGVLVRYRTIEAYYRYEGAGELTASFDNLGTCTLTTTNGSMIPIQLEDFIIQ
jgi:hypothetical protein